MRLSGSVIGNWDTSWGDAKDVQTFNLLVFVWNFVLSNDCISTLLRVGPSLRPFASLLFPGLAFDTIACTKGSHNWSTWLRTTSSKARLIKTRPLQRFSQRWRRGCWVPSLHWVNLVNHFVTRPCYLTQEVLKSPITVQFDFRAQFHYYIYTPPFPFHNKWHICSSSLSCWLSNIHVGN